MSKRISFLQCACWLSSLLQLRSHSIPDQIAAQISAEIKRMHRRKQLHYPMSPSCSPPHSGSSTPPHPSQTHINASELVSPSCSSAALFNPLSPNKRDIPLFTLKQVGLVCERMLKEREAEIREEYDKVLNNKLAGMLFLQCFVICNESLQMGEGILQ